MWLTLLDAHEQIFLFFRANQRSFALKTSRSIATTTMKMSATRSVFVYGTLMAPEVMQTMLARVPPAPLACVLKGYSRHPVQDAPFPAIIPQSNLRVDGLLYRHLTPEDVQALDFFEDEGQEYQRIDVQVHDASDETKVYEAQAYLWHKPHQALDTTRAWDFDHFRETQLRSYLRHVVEPARMAYVEQQQTK